MTMTNANKRQRPAEDREARRHLEPFEHWTDYDFKPIDEVEISDDGDDPAESGEVRLCVPRALSLPCCSCLQAAAALLSSEH